METAPAKKASYSLARKSLVPSTNPSQFSSHPSFYPLTLSVLQPKHCLHLDVRSARSSAIAGSPSPKASSLSPTIILTCLILRYHSQNQQLSVKLHHFLQSFTCQASSRFFVIILENHPIFFWRGAESGWGPQEAPNT